MANNKLKRCPHCAGSACLNSSYSYKIRQYFVFVKCDICGAQGKAYKSENEPASEDWDNQSCRDAIEAWNMRSGDRADNEEYD